MTAIGEMAKESGWKKGKLACGLQIDVANPKAAKGAAHGHG